MQMAVVEFARNVLGWEDAQSSEFVPDTTHPVVVEMPEHNPGQKGGTMRLGKRKTLFKTTESILSECVYRVDDAMGEIHGWIKGTATHNIETPKPKGSTAVRNLSESFLYCGDHLSTASPLLRVSEWHWSHILRYLTIATVAITLLCR